MERNKRMQTIPIISSNFNAPRVRSYRDERWEMRKAGTALVHFWIQSF